MVDIDMTIILWQIINFTVLYLLLRYLLYRPVSDFLRQRRESIEGEIKEAKKKNREAERLKAEYKKELEQIDEEAEEIKENAIQRGEKEGEKIISQAQKEVDQMLMKAEKDIQRARYRARIDMRNEVIDLSLSAAEKILQEELSERRHHELIETTLEDMGDGELI